MGRLIKHTGRALVFCVLTILTQVGGLVYLLNFSTFKIIDKQVSDQRVRKILKLASFMVVYCVTTLLIVPLIAKPFGRVPLPLTTSGNLRPLTVWTAILNRNYVRPELRDLTVEVAKEMSDKYPGTIINYLDANFPFIDEFPLLPHRGHDNGKKLDLSFCYNDNKTGQPTNEAPSFIGYGICEEPTTEENNTATECEEKGYWQYSFIRKIVPQGNKENFSFNTQKTKDLVEFFIAQEAIGKIFIEPHLKTRLQLSDEKIRFHGCHAVRHDDHIHVQLK